MALISLRQLLDHAAEHDYGMPAFNINNMEQMLAVMGAAKKTDRPVILQASRGARAYANDIVLRHLIQAAVEMYPKSPSACTRTTATPQTCLSAVTNGFTSVMMDGSLKADAKTPADYDYNVGVTKQGVGARPYGRRLGRGRTGRLGSLETGMGDKEDGHGAEGKLDKTSC